MAIMPKNKTKKILKAMFKITLFLILSQGITDQHGNNLSMQDNIVIFTPKVGEAMYLPNPQGVSYFDGSWGVFIIPTKPFVNIGGAGIYKLSD